jgi:hypothetical protein
METELDQLEKNYEAAQMEIKELDQQAWLAIKGLDHKGGSSDFDPVRYKELKRKLIDRLPPLESKLRKARIQHLQARRVELQRELESIMPEQLRTKANVVKAEELLREALHQHYKVDLKAAAIDNELVTSFEDLRSNQRALQDLIRDITGVVEDIDHDGLTKTENLLIRN